MVEPLVDDVFIGIIESEHVDVGCDGDEAKYYLLARNLARLVSSKCVLNNH